MSPNLKKPSVSESLAPHPDQRQIGRTAKIINQDAHHRFGQRVTRRPRACRDCSAASRRRTMRRPATPSFDGVSSLTMQSMKYSQLHLKCLGRVDLGNPRHRRSGSSPAGRRHSRSFRDVDALVVDLDLFIRVEVVPHQHLVPAAD